jgi:hypothetical protein
MSIELKPGKDLLFNKYVIYHLYINGKKYKDRYVKHNGIFVNEDYPDGDVLQKLLMFNCMALPEKLRTGYLLSGKYIIPMRQGSIDVVTLLRKGNKFIVKVTWLFFRKQVEAAYYNPAMLLKLTAKHATKMGMKDCHYYDSGADTENGYFQYHSKAEGNIKSKIAEAKKMLNKAMEEAEAEMLAYMNGRIKK